MFEDLENLAADFPEIARGDPVANFPVAGRTTLRHKPTGRLFVVDAVTTITVSLSGTMGGRRVVTLDAIKNADVWEVVHHGE